MTSPRPTVMSEMAMVPRPRSGLNRPKCGSQREGGGAQHAAECGHDEMLAEDDVDHEGDVRTDGQVVAVGEIGDALDAEHERRADTGQSQDGAGDEAVDEELDELLSHRAGRLAY
ncbi:MAG TPA: hypothetical protein VGL99_30370 [Chloroflexota bacterium]